MIRVLIVDDEIYAVKGLLSGVRWEAVGVDAVFEAYHAAMAQDVLSREPVDILICDIEMPEASGLELMEWVAERGLPIETVVLTCHSEFQYAQKALQLGGCDYLLKPVVYSDLEDVLRKTIRKVEEKRRLSEEGELYRKYAELWRSRKPLLVERFWEDVLERKIAPNRDAISAAISASELQAHGLERVRLVLVSLEQWEKPLSERDEELMEFALRKAAEELLLESRPGSVIRDRRGNTVVILELGGGRGEADGANGEEGDPTGEGAAKEEEEVEIRQACARYIEACNRYFYCKLSCYVGDAVPIEGAAASYLSLLNLEYRNVGRTNEVIGMDAAFAFAGDSSSGSPAPAASDSMLELADLIESGDKDGAVALVEERLAGRDAAGLSVETLTGYYHGLLQAIYYVLHRKGFTAARLYEGRDWPDARTVAKSVVRYRQWASQAIEAADALLREHRSASPVVQKVKAIVAERLGEELTREELAAAVYLNPAYLSRLFRKETGMVLTDYILQEKMRKASDLLAGTDRSISEIADSLGYGNFSYFARLFRKVYGATPHDYRKSLRRTNGREGAL